MPPPKKIKAKLKAPDVVKAKIVSKQLERPETSKKTGRALNEWQKFMHMHKGKGYDVKQLSDMYTDMRLRAAGAYQLKKPDMEFPKKKDTTRADNRKMVADELARVKAMPDREPLERLVKFEALQKVLEMQRKLLG